MGNVKLHGEIMLDEESREKLKEEIRKEVIAEIKEEGNTSDEIKQFMADLTLCGYTNMIKLTICDMLNQYEDDFKNHGMFKDDYNNYLRLLAIKNILDIH